MSDYIYDLFLFLGTMTEELLSLKWNNHQSHFVDILTFLREQEIFIDATLACGGKLYPAHKFVLSTCSDYFKQMFTKNPNKHPIVFMKDVTCRDLEALLDFMYNGEVNVPQSSLGSLIKTAEGLQIKGLAVPDDPPVPKRDVNIRERRDVKVSRDNSYSPPPKRLRAREKSPHLISSAPAYPSATLPRARSPTSILPNVTTGLLPIEASVDEDSRTSAQSVLSEHSLSLNSKPNLNSQSNYNNDDSTSQSDNLTNQPSNKEPSPGPSGLHKPTQSKEEEVEIKQEDVVDLGQTDEGD
ncbi:UNVERIFIED_CONTAM: hypothetical protein GTU68_030684, partial [Idotea baltica]|nr:hypothetical protein [Idotea baltica]